MPQTKFLFICGACFCLGGTRQSMARPFDESKGYMSFAASHLDTFNKSVVPAKGELPVDEAIIALSKAAGINFIADSTQIPADARVAPFPATPVARDNKWSPTFYGVTEDMCEAAQLAELPYNDTTFLLWKRPNIVETANSLVAAGKVYPQQPLPNPLQVFSALDTFRENSPGWEEIGPNTAANRPISARFRLGDVPPATREPLLALLRYATLRPDWKRESMLSDAFWDTARVLVITPRPNPPATNAAPLVYVAGGDEKGQLLPFFRVDRRLDLLDANLEQAVYPEAPATDADPVAPVAKVEPVAPVEVAPKPGATATDLEAQESLQSLVSLEAKRQPLGTVLTEASKQGGVALSLAQPSPLLVTARVAGMPLHELMGALARLSGATWQKGATGYELQAQPLEKWQQLLLQSGKGDFEGYGIESQFTPEQLFPLRDLEQAVADEIGNKDMANRGVPFSTLSGDLQEQIKQVVQPATANALVRAYNNAFVFAVPNGTLRLFRFAATPDWNIRLLDASDYMTITGAILHQPLAKMKEANVSVGINPFTRNPAPLSAGAP